MDPMMDISIESNINFIHHVEKHITTAMIHFLKLVYMDDRMIFETNKDGWSTTIRNTIRNVSDLIGMKNISKW